MARSSSQLIPWSRLDKLGASLSQTDRAMCGEWAQAIRNIYYEVKRLDHYEGEADDLLELADALDVLAAPIVIVVVA